MSTFTTRTQVDLDPEWVSDLLITAFDGQYGGCNYWINEDDDIESVQILSADDQWRGVTFWLTAPPGLVPQRDSKLKIDGWHLQAHLGDRGDGRLRWQVTLLKEHLDKAWATIVDERPIRSDLVEQFTRSQYEGDLDVDAGAADCLVQIALFGTVVYG